MSFFFPFFEASAQVIVDGYCLTNSNDSVPAEIKVPKIVLSGVNTERLERKVKSSLPDRDSFVTLLPRDTKGFGFVYGGKEYAFVSKGLNGNRYWFFQQLLKGRKASLFYYGKENYRSRRETMLVEKGNGETLVLKNTMSRRKMARRLSGFFEENSMRGNLITAKSISKQDLKRSLTSLLRAIDNS
jgi:hypothetical protein